MEIRRKPFQGVLNIVRFNWHFYLIALCVFVSAFLLKDNIPESLELLFCIGLCIATITVLISLIVSYLIYDFSDLYSLPWLKELSCSEPLVILNVNAGFDETSVYLESIFIDSQLKVCDFYDPQKHTEISIERARKMYPAHANTVQVVSSNLPFEDGEFDFVNIFMAAHEIRSLTERKLFFQELYRITAKEGNVIVTEHLRDVSNFMAFTFGFLHFYTKSSWLEVFRFSCFTVSKEVKTTPFITTFILNKNGSTR